MDPYQALTAGCAVADLSSRSRIWLTGADRVQFLHSFCTQDIKRLTIGQGCEAFLTNQQGKTAGHVIIRVQQGDALVLDTSPGQAAKIIPHLDRFVISDRVEFHDRTAETGELLVAGREAARVLSGVGVDSLPAGLWDHALVTIQGLSCVLQRVDFAGEGSYFLVARSEDFAAIQQALIDAGAVLCDANTVETVRIEAGFPLYGLDITDDNLPQEIGRDKSAISFTKGCYLGQETVARIDALGHVNRLLARVKFAGNDVPPPGTELFAADKPVGKVTSSCSSPRNGAPLAFALLRRAQSNPGTMLTSAAGSVEVIAPNAQSTTS